MTKAIVILTTLISYEMAIKVWAIIKMMKIKVEGWEQKDFEELLKDPKFRKYMR